MKKSIKESELSFQNSIRHNLSLHQKFLKIPNEDPGKSSWWKINPETKPTNKPRRRATYGDSKSFQNKREKAKKKVEAIRSNGRSVAQHSRKFFDNCLRLLFESSSNKTTSTNLFQYAMQSVYHFHLSFKS